MNFSKLEHITYFSTTRDAEAGKVDSLPNIPGISISAYGKWLDKYKDTRTFQGQMLFNFFSALPRYLEMFGVRCVDDEIRIQECNVPLYSQHKCTQWFSNRLGGVKAELFGSYYAIGSPNYLMHFAVGSYNLHIGIVKASITDEGYVIQRMNNKAFKHVVKKYGKGLPITVSLERRSWGNGWASIDCGNFYDVSNADTLNTLLDVKHSRLLQTKLLPLLNRIDEIANNLNPAFIYAPSTLNFRVSYKCNIQCKHCYNSSSGQEQDCIDADVAIRVIQDAYLVGIRTLSLTGGEPMLFRPLIVKMIEAAAKCKYKNINIVTNAYWGSSEEKALKILNTLFRGGFRPPSANLTISAGEFHQEFINQSSYANVIKAHHEIMGTALRVDFEHSVGKGHLIAELMEYLTSCAIDSSWYRLNVRTSLASVGRWKENQEAYAAPQYPVEELGSCEPTSWFTVEPNGNVLPCCGFNRKIEGIVLGNVNQKSVKEIVDDTAQHPAIQALYNLHMHEIHDKVSRHLKLQGDFTNICEACENVLGSRKVCEFLS